MDERPRPGAGPGEHPLRRTKIVCTVGPVSSSTETLVAMIEAGMDVARLNTSHGEIEEHIATAARVREASRITGKPVAVLMDLGGPRPRTHPGPAGRPIELTTGSTVRLSPRGEDNDGRTIVVGYPGLLDDIGPGERVLIDDGNIALGVQAREGGVLRCDVVQGGLVGPNKGVNFPDSRLALPALTERDCRAIRAGVAAGVDYFALSFVATAADLVEAREAIAAEGADVPIIAKIERKLAVEHLDEIVAEADGVMVARGDLGVELSPEDVPVWQRQIIAVASRYNIPVITATQMLESMVHAPRPTRAEASDVANAVWDESDAVMLSAETAVGRYPIETVRMMDRIIRRAEEVAQPTPAVAPVGVDDHSYLIALAVRRIVETDPNLRAVVCFTRSGYSAFLLSKVHVDIPVYGLTPNAQVACRLALARSVVPIVTPVAYDSEGMLRMVDQTVLEHGLLQEGEELVVVASLPLAHQGTTNFVKLHIVGEMTAS